MVYTSASDWAGVLIIALAGGYSAMKLRKEIWQVGVLIRVLFNSLTLADCLKLHSNGYCVVCRDGKAVGYQVDETENAAGKWLNIDPH